MSIPSKDELLTNSGLVSSDETYKDRYHEQAKRYNIGEYMDVLATIYCLKPLGALDIFGKQYVENAGVNEIQKMARDYGLMRLTKVRNNKTPYLNTVYFYPDNIENAKKLMALVWCNIVDEKYKSYMIGKLLGYTKENIVAYYRNHEIILSDELIATMDSELDTMIIQQSLLDTHDIRLFKKI